jgi:hypothetical protein
METEIENVNALLEFAKDWYRTNPGLQIPLDVWEAKVVEFKETDIAWGIYDRDKGIERVNECIVPAFAGLSLGLGTEELYAILDHHGARTVDLCNCYFVTLHDAKGVQSASPFSNWHTNLSLMKAFCMKKETTAMFLEKSEDIYRSPEFNLALLTVPNPDVWPITTIREHVRIGKEGLKGTTHLTKNPTSLNTFRSAEVDFNVFSDQQILELLNRSGNLCLGATSECGFYQNFFHGLFRSSVSNQNLTRIIQVLNNIEDPALIEKVKARMTENLCNAATDSDKEGLSVLSGMRNLDQEKYGALLKSFLLTLSVMPNRLIEGDPHFSHPSNPAFLDDYCKTQNRALYRLQNEIMAVPVEAFQIQHFRAVGRFSSKWHHEQDLSGVDLQALLIHCLKALEVYSSSRHINREGEVVSDLAEEASEYMESLIPYTIKHITPEYKRLEHLSQGSQIMLVKGGMDVRHLPKVTRTDRGNILYDQLGL